MTSLLRCGLLAALFAGVIWGQDPFPGTAPPALKRAVKRLVAGDDVVVFGPHALATFKPLRDRGSVLVMQDAPKVCAARLLEALPDPAEFTMPQLRPDDHTEPMPMAKLPAPPCPKSPN